MKDISVHEIQELTRKAIDSVSFAKSKFPYSDSYSELNAAIIKKASDGENSISFDFVDNSQVENLTIEEIKSNHNRIYLSMEGGQAIYDVHDYPSYLSLRGFNVEIRKSLRQHGYISKSYFISW